MKNMELPWSFTEAVQCRERISGLTHNFYRYPARFSPLFARAAIEAFTEPGDVVLDPFMGGGTTLVEACALKRRALGTDINSLAVFVSKAKTTVLSAEELEAVQSWAEAVVPELNLHRSTTRAVRWIEKGYQRNISGRNSWPIRKTLEMCLPLLDRLPKLHQRRFARCALLKTAQWALDCRKDIPSAHRFRGQLLQNIRELINGARELADTAGGERARGRELATCLHRSAGSIDSAKVATDLGPPRLIVTSPPYPGVHVLYHRWQVQGRKETPAPYWITDCLDGDGASFYTFGDRHQPGLTDYYEAARTAFGSIAKIANRDTVVVQMVAFSDPSWQLSLYLQTMRDCGFAEVFADTGAATSADRRLWRSIPNRKFYADQKGDISASKEVVLFHRLS